MECDGKRKQTRQEVFLGEMDRAVGTRKERFAVVAAATLIGGVTFAQERNKPWDSIEARLEGIEDSIARLEQRLSSQGSGALMDGCPMMQGMMGGGTDHRGGSPNEQWQEAPTR